MANGPLDFLACGEERKQDVVAKAFDQRERNAFAHTLRLHAHKGQLPPEGDWRCWMIMAGRGFGKTRAGAEWVHSVAEEDDPRARIALVAANLGEARTVMVEGESGLMACAPPHCRPIYEPSLRRVRWPNGAEATLFSAAEPDSLRGPQHGHARWAGPVGNFRKRGAGTSRLVGESGCRRGR
ncbi:hypothetical protein GRI58_03095 [Porphyrobacter algicida]|uniref:ATP-binding protein n=1 Tax=Qipengyuania algicida TaxID=1836209 RepID=A0A845AEI3_9SPHN|nr:hypothetical protein [Qipengyuania algicida]